MYKKYLKFAALLLVVVFSLPACDKGTDSPAQTVPVLTTTVISVITQGTAVSGGNITSDGGAVITTRGVCWSTNDVPTIAYSKTINGTGTGSFTANVTGLTANTVYYLRAYAINSAGTGYGNTISFTTLASSENTVTDVDGNVYRTIQIGTQVWMAENLKVTKFKDGETIPHVTAVSAWGNLTTPGFCWSNNTPSNKETYGGWYNWYAVNTGKLAPAGWHVPTDAEWKILADYLGGVAVAGGKMKTRIGWFNPNTGATNESGFSAISVPYRNYDGTISWNIGDGAYFWSTDSFSTTNAMGARLICDAQDLLLYDAKKTYGRSIRCVKD